MVEKTKKEISDLKQMMLQSALVSRTKLLSTLGKSFGGDRDLYKILGYPRILDYSDMEARYSRQDIAKACVDRPVESSWRKKPEIFEDDDPNNETKFEKELKDLNKRLKWMHYLVRLDKLSSIGHYGVLFFGVGDNQPDLINSVENASQLLYLSVFGESAAQISKWQEDNQDERYGLPDQYRIQMFSKGGSVSNEKTVHHSRILHVAPDVLESEVFGTPALKAIYNRLQDLEMISGGSSEMYWRGARPGFSVSNQKDYQFGADAKEAINDELEEFEHQMSRFIKMEGIEIKDLSTHKLESPREYVDTLVDLICAERNIPKRILMGSERGDLASSQDRTNWIEKIQTRQLDHCEPVIIRPFIDRLIEFGIVSEPKGGEYFVKWPEQEEPGEDKIVEVANKAADAIAKYANAPGAEFVMPVEIFLKRFFNFSVDEIKTIKGMVDEKIKEEDARIEEGRKIMEDEETRRIAEEKRVDNE